MEDEHPEIREKERKQKKTTIDKDGRIASDIGQQTHQQCRPKKRKGK